MVHDQGTASLHAGLIERARPRKALASGVIPLGAWERGGGGKSPGAAPGSGALTGPDAAPGRSGAWSGPGTMSPRETGPVAKSPGKMVPGETGALGPTVSDLRAAPHPVTPEQTQPRARRYAMTVRVEADLRWALAHETQTRGRTVQDVLHAALVSYLKPWAG